MAKKAKKTKKKSPVAGFRLASVLTAVAVMAASHLQVQAAIYVQGMEEQARPNVSSIHSAEQAKLRRKAITARINLRAEDRHGDYLNYVQAPPSQKTMNEYFFDQEITKELTQRYESISDKYEFKKHYGIDGWEDHYQYQTSNKDLMDWVVKKMTQYHIERSMKNVPKDSPAGQTVGTAIRTAQAFQNTSVSFSEKTKAKFRYDLPRGKASMGFISPFVDTTVDYVVRSVNQQPVPGTVQTEKLSASVSKSFSDLGAGGGARYGMSNRTMNYYVSKHLVGPLSAQVDQVDYLGSKDKDETIYRVNFGVGF